MGKLKIKINARMPQEASTSTRHSDNRGAGRNDARRLQRFVNSDHGLKKQIQGNDDSVCEFALRFFGRRQVLRGPEVGAGPWVNFI